MKAKMAKKRLPGSSLMSVAIGSRLEGDDDLNILTIVLHLNTSAVDGWMEWLMIILTECIKRLL